MDTDSKYYYFMDCVPKVGMQTAKQLMEVFEEPKQCYHANLEQLTRLLGQERAAQWCYMREQMDLEAQYHLLEQKGISFYSYWDKKFPSKLRNIPDPPLALYVKGELPDEQVPCMAVIGTRRCSCYGREVARALGAALGLAGVQVVSGMAMGIDGIAQEATLDAGGKTFGVLGCGVDVCYPDRHQNLYERLQKSGGVLSSYKPGTMPKPELFPPRNRIISGLSDGVIVVEAGEKSGTLITVDMALEQGREIYCVPGRISDRLSEGCNRLIDMGAHMVLSVEGLIETILGDWKGTLTEKENLLATGIDKIDKSMTKREKEVYCMLDIYPVSGEQIYLQLSSQSLYNWSFKEVSQTLWELVSKGVIESLSGGLYAKKSSY